MTTSGDFDRVEATIRSLDGIRNALQTFFEGDNSRDEVFQNLTVREFRERYEEMEAVVGRLQSLERNLKEAYEHENADLRTSQRSLKEEQEKLAADRLKLEAVIGQVDQEKVALQHARTLVEEDQLRLTSQSAELDASKATLEKDQQAYNKANADLKEEQAEVERSRAAHAQQGTRLEEKARSLSGDRKIVRDKNDDLVKRAARLEDREKRSEIDRSALEGQKSENAILQDKLKEWERSLTHRENEFELDCSIQDHDVELKTEELEKTENSLDRRDRVLREKELQCSSLEAKLDFAKIALEREHQGKEEAFEKEKATFEADKEGYREQLRKEVDSIEEKKAALEKEKAAFAAQMKAREAELGRLEDQVSSQLNARKKVCEKAEADIEAQRNAMRKDNGKLDQLVKSFSGLGTRIEQSESNLKQETAAIVSSSFEKHKGDYEKAVNLVSDKVNERLADLAVKLDETLARLRESVGHQVR
ncbi:MAG: hypothetical protein L6R41_001593 [Letrouitia leprolyta]|nr:MAG: hypothetical protein L6R41_001593 [Letrouitia leprolyta]